MPPKLASIFVLREKWTCRILFSHKILGSVLRLYSVIFEKSSELGDGYVVVKSDDSKQRAEDRMQQVKSCAYIMNLIFNVPNS